ncbi:class I SAM-dependent methyltransferase [Listeria innocua]|uniref:class I SAM-dependent methyltransferase n=1 Tax=Listeria TaxID=1637 RepID=UPI000E6D5592|nr:MULTISPECIES: class I SAM-dependent methyltransferase [Listeria]EKQ3636458.1 class I SAM-dependent methyltransferase [Enterococcus faecalis]EAD5717937.1 class I SAM-dependent methyltransferase [Listeria innocua]EAF7006030.1 class I SAM-dependent methyltransferase [Listeria monocytogenes]EAH3615171.1 class I SAM-dependent methyltransferase [Listeria monocytogenes]EHL7151047.1 class I SAM-dependent methyltransferase [Listeria monocytogenes]
MLESKIRTQEEIEQYMTELKTWLKKERNTPIEEMTDFFTNRLAIYENVHLGHWAKEYAHIADYFNSELDTLLDIGCGTGLELEAIYRRFPNASVTGIDLSKNMLEKLNEKYKNKEIELILADYFEYDFGTEKYTAALSFETLHHFEYQKKQKIYQKLYRTIKQGGYYIECDYIACNKEEEDICLEQYHYRRRVNNIPDDVFVHIDIPLTIEHQIDLMKNAGFKDVRVLYENCGTMIIRADK